VSWSGTKETLPIHVLSTVPSRTPVLLPPLSGILAVIKDQELGIGWSRDIRTIP